MDTGTTDLLQPVRAIATGVLVSLERMFGGLSEFDYGRIALAVLVFTLFFLLRRLFRHVFFTIIGKLFTLNMQAFRDDLGRALKGPVELMFVAVGTFLAFEVLKVAEDGALAQFSGHVVQTLLIAAAYWTIIALVDPLMEQAAPRSGRMTETVIDWIRKALKCIVAFFAIVAVLQQWGVRIGPLLAGMGIAGAAVALGAQELFKNLISGVLILLERRFQYGDWVKVPNVVEGTVESIGFRSTRIRQFDDAAVQVPNSDLADNSVINYTQMRRRRIYWIIGVPYSTTVEQLRDIRQQIEDYIHGADDFVSYKQASTFVRIDSFGASSINIMVYCFTKTTNWGEWLAVKEKLAWQLMDIVAKAGSSFAFPSTSLYVESLPADRPEAFLPPEEGRPRLAPIDGAPAAAPPAPNPAASNPAAPKPPG